jgi:hypothetical protein
MADGRSGAKSPFHSQHEKSDNVPEQQHSKEQSTAALHFSSSRMVIPFPSSSSAQFEFIIDI